MTPDDIARRLRSTFAMAPASQGPTSGAGACRVGVAYASLAINGAVWRRGYLLVLDDFGGRLGRAWRETAEEDANHETLIRDLMDDQYSHLMRIIAFNTAEGWSRDVALDIADELRRRFAEYDEVPTSVQELLEMARRPREPASDRVLPMTVFYVNTSKQVGDPEHLKVFVTADAAANGLRKTIPKASPLSTRFWSEPLGLEFREFRCRRSK